MRSLTSGETIQLHIQILLRRYRRVHLLSLTRPEPRMRLHHNTLLNLTEHRRRNSPQWPPLQLSLNLRLLGLLAVNHFVETCFDITAGKPL